MLEKLKIGDCLLVVSPHLDDAVLSVGGIMDAASKKGVRTIAATIFTADAPDDVKATPSVQQLHARWGLGANPNAVRREEDVEAVEFLGVEHLHGDVLDALYRTDSDGNALYSSQMSRFSAPTANDPIFGQLQSLFEKWLDLLHPKVVLCPLGVGRHVDHTIATEAFREIAHQKVVDVYLYEDMPYAAGLYPPDAPDTVTAAISRSPWKVSSPVSVQVDVERKVKSISAYRSQIAGLFPDGRDVGQEMKRYMLSEENNGYNERVWAASAA